MRHILCVLLLIAGMATTLRAEEFQVVGADLPPLMYEKDGQPAGFYYELLQIILEELPQTTVKVTFCPVPRLLETVAETPNTFALGIGWSPERDKRFKWVGPSIQMITALYKLKSRADLQHVNLHGAHSYQVGVGRSYAVKDDLSRAGFSKESIQEVVVDINNIRKMYAQRIDFVATVNIVFWYLMQQDNHLFNEVDEIKLGDRSMFYAFNKNVDDEVIQRFQQALDRVKKTKRYEELINKYVPKQ